MPKIERVALSRKINTGNYSNVSIHLEAVPYHTETEIQVLNYLDLKIMEWFNTRENKNGKSNNNR